MQLESLYSDIIQEHAKSQRYSGLREPFDGESEQVNPTCGDEIKLRVTLKDTEGDSVLADVSYEAVGCQISLASASVMAEMIVGKTLCEVRAIYSAFHTMMQSRGTDEPDEEVLADAVAFKGASKYPMRVKCALLGWMAWKDATARALETKEQP